MPEKLKCWKKDFMGGNVDLDYGILYIPKKHEKTSVGIYKERTKKSHIVSVFRQFKSEIKKDFKSKSQALKFAKSYMRKHDKC